ncbi:MAG: alpha-amylase [Paludibacter sp.]|nr:alpha-amylase [Paludibacter sp.]
MKNICFYFQISEPVLLKRYRFFEIGQDHYYYDDFHTNEHVDYQVENSYLTANKTIAEMIRSSNGKFRCSFAISGIALELFEQFAPQVIDSFKELAKTGAVDFVAQPYADSLASIFDAAEFEKQITMHAEKVKHLFGIKPTAFFNSELIYSDEIGEIVSKLGYKLMLIEEAKSVLGWKSPNYVYKHAYLPKLKLLVRNWKLSDDVSLRFITNELTAEKFISWIEALPEKEEIVNLAFGYESFGIVNNAGSGIFDFLKALPYHAMERQIAFVLPSDYVKKVDAVDVISTPFPISWVGNDKDLTSWTGNDLQQEALNKLYAVSERVHLCNDKPLQRDWLLLQSSNHFRYMSHRDAWGSPYESAYDAFMNYTNVLADFLERVDAQYPTTIENEELSELLKTINSQEKEIAALEEEVKKLRSRKKTETK